MGRAVSRARADLAFAPERCAPHRTTRPNDAVAASQQRPELHLGVTPTCDEAPGAAIRFWFDSFPKRKGADLPMRIPLDLEYDGPDGRHYGPERYVLDLSAYGPALHPDKRVPDLVEEVERISKSITAAATQLSVLALSRSPEDLR